MKKIILLLAIFFTISISYSQDKNQDEYKKIYKYGIYQKDWALVKTITGNYGIINREGEIIVKPIYAKIEKFTENKGELAKVKSITGNFGLIDQNGKEVVPTIYSKIGNFGEYGKDIVLVKSVPGNYGFIDKNGNIIVETIYSLKEIKRDYLKLING